MFNLFLPHRIFFLKDFLFCLLLSFVSLNSFAQPSITSFSPASGPIGTNVTITGSNFSTTPANNIVFFGAVRANVTAAAATLLTVTVPAGATYQPITVTVNGLTAFSSRIFNTTFTGGGQINSNSFSARTDFTTDLHPNAVVVADLDGDGKPDIASPNNYSTTGQPASVSVLRNTSTAAGINFAPVLNFNNGVATYALASGDIDGDGKLDLVASSNADLNISVFRNTSFSGSISFAPKIDFPAVGGVHGINISDIDGDGKQDIAVVNSVNGVMSVYRNTGIPGSISFAPKLDFLTSIGPESIASSDFDGDGKTDLAVTNNLVNTFSIFRNTSTPGTISFASIQDINLGSGIQPYGVTVADLDNDGKTDLVVTRNYTNSSGAVVYRNTSSTGSISFSLSSSLLSGASGSTTYHTAIGDINGDGKPDILMASNPNNNQIQVFQNNSTSGSISFPLSGYGFNSRFAPYGIACCDFDADGKPDLAVSEFTMDNISVLKNKCGTPEILGFTPNTAGTGTTVTISGTNFTGISGVSFGGIPASSFTVVNATTISAVVGSGASGDVVVTNSIGSTSKSGFQFAGPPVVNSFTPASGFNGTSVIINGLNFNGATGVSFGGTAASSFSIIDPFKISAIVGAGASGSVNVTTSFGNGSLPGFTYAPVPQIASFSPQSAGTSSSVTITGINFTGTTAVSFGSVPAASFTVVNNTTITAVVGAGASGNISVTNAFGTHSLAGFTYIPQPVITSFNPSSAGAGTSVVISGTNFTNASTVKFGGINANSFTVINSTTINAVLSTGGASGPVSVTTPGGTGSLAGFTFIPAPAISSFSPTNTGSGALVTITGSDLAGATAVSFGNVAASSFTVINSTTITAIVGNGASGNVTVITPGGTAQKSQFIYVTTPIINNFTPASGPVGTVVTITGANYNTIPANNIVYFGAVRAPVIASTVNSLTVTVPAGASYKPITVTINNFTTYSFNPFTVIYAGGGSFNINSFTGRTDFVTGGNPESVATGDLDGDGKPDAVIANGFSNTISIYRNTSTTTSLSFAPKIDSAAGIYPHAVKIEDINGDGKLDILFLNYNNSVVTGGPQNSISIFRNISTQGNLAFDSRRIFATNGIDPFEMVISDLNTDGKPDIAVTHVHTFLANGNPFITTYINTSSVSGISFGLGAQTEIQVFPNREFTTTISAADINFDSKPDLIVSTTGSFSATKVLINGSSVGSPVFSQSSQHLVGNCSSNTSLAYTADFDGDGKIDVISDNCLFRNTTNDIFVSFASHPFSGLGGLLAIDALSGSSRPDFVKANYTTNTITAVRNTSSPGVVSFDPGVNYNTGENPFGIAVADFNGDGKPDIATSNKNFNTFSVLLNKAGISGLSISSFSPINGTNGAVVTITGTNFIGVTGVSFGGIAASSFTVVNATTITATVGQGTSGNVSITNATGTATQGWFYYPPFISSFTPTTSGTGLSVTINGDGFIGATNVSFGGTPASSFTVISPTTIVAVVAAGTSGDVSVTTPGGTASLSGFTYALAPTVTSFNPMSGGTGTVVAITGTNFSGATQVRFGAASASSYTVNSSTSISAIVGTGSTGNVFVTTPGGTANSINQFFTFIPAPGITSFVPATATTGVTVTITGTNFTGATVVSFEGIPASTFTVVNSTTITAIVGAGATGNVSVTTPGGTATKSGFIFITAPTITSFTPANAASGATITIIGTNFTGATAVNFGGVAASSFTVVNATTLTAVVGAGASGNISVTASGGTATLAGFTYNIVTGTGGPGINSKDLSANPNPGSGIILIKHPASIKNAKLSFIDVLGRSVKETEPTRNSRQTYVDIGKLKPGVFIIIWSDGSKTLTRTFLVR